MRLVAGFLVMCLACLGYFVADAQAQSPAESIVVTFDTQQNVGLHEPVIVYLTVKNGLTQQVEFDLGRDLKSNLQLEVTGPDAVVRNLPPYVPSGAYEVGRVALRPGAEFTKQYVLNEWTVLNQLGRYRLRIRANTPFQTEGGDTLSVPGQQTLILTVGSRDAARLRQICDRLAVRASTAPAVADQLDAARALAYVTDPGMCPESCRKAFWRNAPANWLTTLPRYAA